MRTLRITCSLLLLLAALLDMNGCLRRTAPPEEDQARKPSREDADSHFEPLDLPQDREIVPEERPMAGEIRLGDEDIAIDTAGRAMTLPPAFTRRRETADSLLHQAYRIQIFSSKLYGEARWEMSVAEEIFDRPVKLDYEVPYYKVRVGSFASRDEAESYLQRVRTAGYPEAWVVVVSIDTREAPLLYPQPLQADSVPPEGKPDSANYGIDD
ncbi:MAG: SPOR domain-containing protein [Candidatus Zixiibacteriota bacterium]